MGTSRITVNGRHYESRTRCLPTCAASMTRPCARSVPPPGGRQEQRHDSGLRRPDRVRPAEQHRHPEDVQRERSHLRERRRDATRGSQARREQSPGGNVGDHFHCSRSARSGGLQSIQAHHVRDHDWLAAAGSESPPSSLRPSPSRSAISTGGSCSGSSSVWSAGTSSVADVDTFHVRARADLERPGADWKARATRVGLGVSGNALRSPPSIQNASVRGSNCTRSTERPPLCPTRSRDSSLHC